MNPFNSPEFKVGLLVVIVSGLIAVMSLRVAEGPGVLGGTQHYFFMVDNASGLVKNSVVKMAGIPIGVIEEITLVDGRARVTLMLEGEVPITTSGTVELRSDGILGDRHVEVRPGDPSDPPLPEGSQIPMSDSAAGLDNVMKEVSRITKSLNQLADTLTRATEGEGDDSSPIGRIVLNIERITEDLADVTGENREKINDIIARVQNLARNLDGALNEESLARVEAAVRNIEEITEKINEGEGTIGRLINDEQTVEELNSAISNVNTFLGGASKMETSIDFHSEYLSSPDLYKSYLGIKIQPGLDRYYEIQVIDDPRGVTSITETTAVRDGGDPTTVEETKVYKSKVKFSALFAKNFYNFTVKGGIIENAGGVGFDYHMFNKKLRLSLEVFEFGDPYVRAFARYNFLKGVYLIAGGDNIADSNEASAFVGGGIFITNDDLKMLASKVSF